MINLANQQANSMGMVNQGLANSASNQDGYSAFKSYLDTYEKQRAQSNKPNPKSAAAGTAAGTAALNASRMVGSSVARPQPAPMVAPSPMSGVAQGQPRNPGVAAPQGSPQVSPIPMVRPPMQQQSVPGVAAPGGLTQRMQYPWPSFNNGGRGY